LMDEFADIDEGIGTKLGLGFETSTQLSGNLTWHLKHFSSRSRASPTRRCHRVLFHPFCLVVTSEPTHRQTALDVSPFVDQYGSPPPSRATSTTPVLSVCYRHFPRYTWPATTRTSSPFMPNSPRTSSVSDSIAETTRLQEEHKC
jgi:hypothetical protein